MALEKILVILNKAAPHWNAIKEEEKEAKAAKS